MPSVTIKHARQKLGEKGKHMTDKQINDLLSVLRSVCRAGIEEALSERKNEN